MPKKARISKEVPSQTAWTLLGIAAIIITSFWLMSAVFPGSPLFSPKDSTTGSYGSVSGTVKGANVPSTSQFENTASFQAGVLREVGILATGTYVVVDPNVPSARKAVVQGKSGAEVRQAVNSQQASIVLIRAAIGKSGGTVGSDFNYLFTGVGATLTNAQAEFLRDQGWLVWKRPGVTPAGSVDSADDVPVGGIVEASASGVAGA